MNKLPTSQAIDDVLENIKELDSVLSCMNWVNKDDKNKIEGLTKPIFLFLIQQQDRIKELETLPINGFEILQKASLENMRAEKEIKLDRDEARNDVKRLRRYLRNISEMKAEDNFKSWKDKVNGVETWQEEFFNDVIIKPINDYAKKALEPEYDN